MTSSTINTPLRDAMYAMSMAKPIPDADLLDEFVRLYPQHADALTAFAIELAIDGLLHNVEDLDIPADREAISPIVSRVMSRFQNRLYEVQQGQAAKPAAGASSASVENPFSTLDRDEFRALASRINVTTVLLVKLRDRQIEPTTIPKRFCRWLADEMDEPLPKLGAHLYAPPETSRVRQYFKSEGKPAIPARQSFEEAVHGSGLTREQRAQLLAFRD